MVIFDYDVIFLNVLLLSGYPISRFVDYIFYINCIFDRGLDSIFKRNYVAFLVDFRELKNLEIMSLDWISSSRFSNELWYHDALQVLGWISRNWVSFKDMQRLTRVDI